MTLVAILIPDDALLFDVARQAQAQRLHLVTNGDRFALTPIVPTGWEHVPVAFKEPTPCNA